ncbi:MAG: 50S ribosomal protein L31e [Poseidonia sp.]|jgi:large subunit ribosomal protein L31e|nr:50S ribosomal protein L31e [Euryarchaeota archaeon]MDP6199876.1 50S ribosomal protein L31e [Poseidonia sp.]MEC8681405.1 50S ribosomal protein L31e [Candidatus Thermoplasmatota archaeon]|tara:strand:- start:68 stop:343 length:276 start_codon:yes stop_codon:yes gene_type:complete
MARPNESELIVPLRNAWNITRYKRAPRAMQIIREQVIRHLKVREDEELYIDPEVNEHIWKRGIENPPRKVRLLCIRHDEPDFPVEVKLMKE